MATSRRSWISDRLTHDLRESIIDSLSMLAFDSKPIISSFMRLGGGLLCLSVTYFLKLLGGSIELNFQLDVSAISNCALHFMFDFVYLSVLLVFVAGLPTIASVINAFFSEALNSERKMIDKHSAGGSVSEGDGKSKANTSFWNRGRGFKSGNNNDGYNGGVGCLNNVNRYISPSGAHNSNQLRWRQKIGSDVTQQKYRLPMTNPPAPTWSRNYIQAQNGIVAASTISSARREKVYCDKWIHDGDCAFTQVGCKYLHTMPMDTETQVKLGLYHGLPRWYYVRTQNWRQIKEPANNGGNNNASTAGTTTYDSSNGSWPSNHQDQSWGNVQTSFGRAHSFGPIAPPNKASTKL